MIDERKLYETIGQEIKKIRKTKGYNQSELASKINIERTSITNIESGRQKVTLFALYKICALFEIEPSDLLPEAGEVSIHNVMSNREVMSKGQQRVQVGPKTWAALERLKTQ